MGFLMFGATVLGFTRRKAGRSLARREYPKLAARLGLTFDAPARPGEVGVLRGEVEGVRVRVESDGRARAVCFTSGRLPIDVRNYPHHKRTPAGFEAFSFKNHVDDRWAQNRFIELDQDPSPYLNALRALLLAIGADRERLEGFTVDGEKVECVFNFGSPAYLPAAVVSRVLPAMVALARLSVVEPARASVGSG